MSLVHEAGRIDSPEEYVEDFVSKNAGRMTVFNGADDDCREWQDLDSVNTLAKWETKDEPTREQRRLWLTWNC